MILAGSVLSLKVKTYRKWQGQLLIMIIFDRVSLALDVEQMKLSATAVKDTEEVHNLWREIPFL